ncbi:MAG: bifunctional nuclease family protein [Acidobacteria bacterium]|nr:bifunctional nuclease family protein [Acidobacteriota bacterium]
MEREVRVRGLLVDPTTNTPIVLLKDVESDALVPIWVGAFEANSIATEIEKVAPHRPMTHDLLRTVINQFGGNVSRVVVTELRDNTFYAIIEIEIESGNVIIDSRPSDAIALALRVDCPIYIRDEVFVASGLAGDPPDQSADEDADDEVVWPEEIEDISDYRM